MPRRVLPWIKVWSTDLNEPKMNRLTLAEYGCLNKLSILANGSPVRGQLMLTEKVPMNIDDIVTALHLKHDEIPVLESCIEKLKTIEEIVIMPNGAISLPNFVASQEVYESDFKDYHKGSKGSKEPEKPPKEPEPPPESPPPPPSQPVKAPDKLLDDSCKTPDFLRKEEDVDEEEDGEAEDLLRDKSLASPLASAAEGGGASSGKEEGKSPESKVKPFQREAAVFLDMVERFENVKILNRPKLIHQVRTQLFRVDGTSPETLFAFYKDLKTDTIFRGRAPPQVIAGMPDRYPSWKKGDWRPSSGNKAGDNGQGNPGVAKTPGDGIAPDYLGWSDQTLMRNLQMPLLNRASRRQMVLCARKRGLTVPKDILALVPDFDSS